MPTIPIICLMEITRWDWIITFWIRRRRFYQKYREAVKEQLMYENQYAGLMKFTDSQIEVLDRKIAGIDTPV